MTHHWAGTSRTPERRTGAEKQIILLISLFFCFTLPVATPADTTVNSNITVDTTWTVAGSPYIVTSPFQVYGTDGADNVTTLTIEPGVEVRFTFMPRKP